MHVAVLEADLNFAADSACIEPLKRIGEVAGCTIAFIEGRPQNLAADKDIDRQKQRQATYLT